MGHFHSFKSISFVELSVLYYLKYTPLDPRMGPANVALIISGDPVQFCKRILYFCDFSGGGGGRP